MTSVAFTKLYLGEIEETGRRDEWNRVIQRHPMFGDEDVRISFPFGDRPALTLNDGTILPPGHRGTDWAPVPAGRTMDIVLPERATAGFIQRLDLDTGKNGYAVIIRHGYPWWSMYLHLLDDPRGRWSVGDEVFPGDLIGIMDATGAVAGRGGDLPGSHLHHAVWSVEAPGVWGLDEPPGFFANPVATPRDPELFYFDEPPAPPQPRDWMEPRDWGTQTEWEVLVGPNAYHDIGTKVGTAPGDLDARVKVEDDGIGLVEVAEIRRRL